MRVVEGLEVGGVVADVEREGDVVEGGMTTGVVVVVGVEVVDGGGGGGGMVLFVGEAVTIAVELRTPYAVSFDSTLGVQDGTYIPRPDRHSQVYSTPHQSHFRKACCPAHTRKLSLHTSTRPGSSRPVLVQCLVLPYTSPLSGSSCLGSRC